MIRRLLLALALAGVLPACEGPRPPAPIVAAPAPAAPPATQPPPAPVPPAPPPAPSPAPVTTAPPLDVPAWLAEHHVALPDFPYSDCQARALGSPARDGLVCAGAPPMEASLRSGHSVFPLVAMVAEGGKLRTVLETAVMAGPLSHDGDGDPAYVRLQVEVSADGTRITLADSPGRTCAEALAHAATIGDPANARMVRLCCASRGTHVWTRGLFRRGTR